VTSNRADARPGQLPGIHADFHTALPNMARVWDYWLGGRQHFAVDRARGDLLATAHPGLVTRVRSTREFLIRAVSRLSTEGGIRQFLDIGCGLPTAGSTHETAQQAGHETRVVYVDNDRQIVRHAAAVLGPLTEAVTCVQGDLHEPEAVLTAAAGTLDLSRPVALVLGGVLGHVPTHEEACDLVGRLMGGLPSGSHLVALDISDTDRDWCAVQARHNAGTSFPYHLRTPEQIAGYFHGLDVLEPGVAPVTALRPVPGQSHGGARPELAADVVGGIGRKP
jgi:O-methyltransferase involved in polyketide biosynthesis